MAEMPRDAINAGKYGVWAGAALLLAACGSESEPSGQVVATVAGEEITLSELESEMRLMQGGGASENIRNAALQGIVNREIIARAAKDEGVDGLPETAMRIDRMQKIGLIEAFAAKIRATSPEPSGEEVALFIQNNPAMFAQRHLFVVDQALVGTNDQALLKAMEPMQSLGEIKTLLDQRGVSFSQTVAMVDPLALSPEQAKILGGLRAGEVFILPGAGGMQIGQVRQIIDAPIAGENASKIAGASLKDRRSGEIVANRLAQIVKAGQGSVKYNPQIASR